MTENEAKLWGLVAGLVGYAKGEITGNDLGDMFEGLAPDMEELKAARAAAKPEETVQ